MTFCDDVIFKIMSKHVFIIKEQFVPKHKVNLKVFNHKTNTYNFLEHKDYVRYLGVLIDNNLTWKYHISHIASKISKTIGIIARLRHFVPTERC